MHRTAAALGAVLVLAACDTRPSPAPAGPPAGRGGGGPFDGMLDASTEFVLAVAAERHSNAYDRLCPGTRAGLSLAGFTAAMRANAYLRGATAVTRGPGRGVSSGGVALYSLSVTSQVGLVAVDVYFAEHKQAGCISGLIVGGTPALPMPVTDTAPPAASAP